MPLCSSPDVSDAAEACPGPVSGDASTRVPWYAIWVRSNREFQVRDALEAAGILSFLPTWPETVEWSDRRKTIERPLFPGYLFARMSNEERHRALWTSGVIQLLPNSFDPKLIESGELENIRLLAAARLECRPCDFAAGEIVTVDSGPLAGVSGIVKRTKGALRVVVSIELLRRSVSVELDAATLLKKAVA